MTCTTRDEQPPNPGGQACILSKSDNVKVMADEDPIAQLVESARTARRLRSYEEVRHLHHTLVLPKS